MREEPLPQSRIRFGDVTLDPATAEIERDGTRRRLPDQAFAALVLLTSRPGELVTREELIARLWPKTTYIDTEAGLNTAIKRLRAELGDDAEQPRYVETVPRRGYRFVADVASTPEATVPRSNAASWWSRHPQRAGLAAAALAAAGVVLAAWIARDVSSPRDPAPDPAAVSALPETSIAVLPFLNLTGDARQDYLALGLAESVLHRLAQLQEINVIARTSSFAFRGRSEDVREIGRKLDARYLLEGSVQGSAARMRATLQLIDASSGRHVWSKSFDRAAADLLALEDEIAAEVARAMAIGRVDGGKRSLRFGGTADPDAWLAFQQGRALASTRSYENLRAAVTSLEQAVRLDPKFAAAWVELADAYLLRAQYVPMMSREDARRVAAQGKSDAIAAVEQALTLDPKLGEALIARGAAASLTDDWPKAEADVRAGLALSPNSARGHRLLGEQLARDPAKSDEALAVIGRARLLDPLEPRGPYDQGMIELLRGNVDAAERLMMETLQLRPDYAPALTRLSMLSWWQRGRFADAIKYGERALSADPKAVYVRNHLATSYLELGEVEAAWNLLQGEPADLLEAVPVLLHTGDFRGASSLVHRYPERFSECDYGLDVYAVLEQASPTERADARRLLMQNGGIALGGQTPAVKPGAEHAAVALAQLMQSAGEARGAWQLLEAVLLQLDRAGSRTSGNCVNVERARARALALLGKNGEALTALTRAMLRDDAWYYGWYVFESDAAYARLHSDPDFRSLHAAYRKRVAAEQVKLTEMRAIGLVPKRP